MAVGTESGEAAVAAAGGMHGVPPWSSGTLHRVGGREAS